MMLISFFLHLLPIFDGHDGSVSYVRMFTKNSKYDDHATWFVTQILPSSSHPFLSGVLLLNLIARLSDLVDLVNIILRAW